MRDALTLEQVRERIRAACEKAGGQSKWAREIGIFPNDINRALRGIRPPTPSILFALGLRRRIMYVETERTQP